MLATYLQVVLSGLAVGGIYALIALSFSITFTTTKTLNLAQGVFIGIGAFLGVAALAALSGKGTFASLEPDASTGGTYTTTVVAVGVVMAVLGLLLFVTAVRPFADKPGMSWVMSTIGFGIILQNLGLAIWGPVPVNLPPPFGDEVIRIAGAGVRRRRSWSCSSRSS